MGRRGYGVLAILLATSSAQCKGTRCAGPLVVVSRAVTVDDLALPVLGGLQDVEKPRREQNGCEYGDEEHQAKLGPLSARYTAWDYKGQKITSNATLYLSSAPCSSTTVSFTMSTRSNVHIRHDSKRDVYIVTDGYGDPPGDAGSVNEKPGLIVRISATN